MAAPVAASSIVDITEIGVGARPLGMGKAFNSIADDGSAIFTNPAGLTNVKNFDLISMSGNLINEVPYLTLGGAWRKDRGVWGIGYVGASVAGIREAVLVGPTPEVTGNEASFANSTFVISYAQEARDVGWLRKIDWLTERDAQVGANLKLVSQGFTGGASFEGGNASGFDLDIGLIASLNDDLTGSLALKNIIPGNNVGPDELPLGLSAGIAHENTERKLTTALDAELNNGAFLLHLGAEWNPLPALFLRSGLDQAADGFNLAFGVGTQARGFTFDYAYHTYAELSEFTTHYFSIGYQGEEQKTIPAQKLEPPRSIEINEADLQKAPASQPQLSAEQRALIAKINAYIQQLETKLAAANTPARISQLKQLIKAQRDRLAKIKR